MPISGEEFCVPVMQALHQQGIAADDPLSFADQNEISDWALESVNAIFPISGAGQEITVFHQKVLIRGGRLQPRFTDYTSVR